HLRATRLFVRRARPGLYFNRVPSLPATDDGNARPLAEDLSTSSSGSEEITWDADTEPGTADAGVAPAAGPNGGPHTTEAAGADGEPRTTEAAEADGEPTPPEAEPRVTEAAAGPLKGAEAQADAARAEGAPRADAEPRVGESGRWFRPAMAKTDYLAIQADEQADTAVPGAEPQVTAMDASPGDAVATPGSPEPGLTETSTAETSTAETSTAETSTAETSTDGGQTAPGAPGTGTAPGSATAGTAPGTAEVDAAPPSAEADLADAPQRPGGPGTQPRPRPPRPGS